MSHSNHQPQSPRPRPPLSPVFDPKASSTRPRLYGNKLQHPIHSNDTSHLRHSHIEDYSQSNEIDTLVKYNTTCPHSPKTDPYLRRNSTRSQALRNIFSPIPKPDSADDFITSTGSSSSPTVYVSSSCVSQSKQTERRSSDIVFPSIKVDSYCDDGSVGSTSTNFGRLSVTEKRSRSTGNLFMSETFSNQEGFDYRENNNNYNGNNNNNSTKCLMVPPTLVRTRSTDGRLMVGTKDRSMLPTISKAWSKSDGNFFSGKSKSTSCLSTTPPQTSNQRPCRPESGKTRSNEIKPEDTEFQFDEILETKSYKKLGPISSTHKTDTLLSNSSSHENDNSISSCTISSLSKTTSNVVTSSGQSVSENNISIFQRNTPTLLNVLANPNEGSFSLKQQRSKSYSPRRRSPNPENNVQEGSVFDDDGCQRSAGTWSECQTKKEKLNKNISFISTQQFQKLGPIHQDKSDI